MKRRSYIKIAGLAAIFIISSCGMWRDNIHLSMKKAEFSADGDSVLITTKGGGWWVSCISVNDSNYYDFKGVNVITDHYKITGNCFVVERRDKFTLFISLSANQEITKRIVKVNLEDGDYFDWVTITQKPK